MSRLSPNNSVMLKVSTKANAYIRKHGIKRLPCQVCDKAKTQMHHVDYSKPYLVVFLCAKCHGGVRAGRLETPGPVDLTKQPRDRSKSEPSFPLRMPYKVHEWFRQEAFETRESMNSLIVQVLEDYCAEREGR